MYVDVSANVRQVIKLNLVAQWGECNIYCFWQKTDVITSSHVPLFLLNLLVLEIAGNTGGSIIITLTRSLLYGHDCDNTCRDPSGSALSRIKHNMTAKCGIACHGVKSIPQMAV